MTNTFVFRPINMKATGRRIRDCRTARNLTVEQLSTLFSISPQAVCKWQRGDALPTIDNLMVLCDLFQVKVEDLIVRDGDGSSVFLPTFQCGMRILGFFAQLGRDIISTLKRFRHLV